MKVEQLYTGCLAEAAYYIVSNGEAAIIDPLRETQPYLDKLKEDGVELKYIFETHFHADFVSGHLDLSAKTGATIVYGPTATPNYDVLVAHDGQDFPVGDVTIRVLHTPGHTMESTTYLLIDQNGKEHSIFTGDTLFIGDVGRPDLAIKSDLTQEDLAGYLFESTRNKIMPLSDDVIVYPGHGAGSACGKNLSSKTWDTLGNQKKTNYALREDMSKEEFIKEVTTGLLPPPQYFPKNAMMNKMGYESFDEVLTRGVKGLSVEEFKNLRKEGALVLDTRNTPEYEEGHVPGSWFIGLDGNFAMWVGALIHDIHQPIIFIAPEGREEEVVTRLSRVGYDKAKGFLKGGIQAWMDAGEEIETVTSIEPKELEKLYNGEESNIVDVRKNGEFTAQHIEGAIHYPLDYINEHVNDLDKEKTYLVHCAGGYRSVVAISILKANGYQNLVNVHKGFSGIQKETELPITEYVCPTSML
ncbi:MAG: MBL fold metallo-hydrolase [Bacteroidota bacterium]|nr:MBL fold metallo-hydrolase [Bacteroidota bacterium]MDX5505015.1 MBL fold metallo-hydrolase [Bacteroidota bacterium]